MNSEKNDNDHDDYNRPPPEPPPINSQTEKIITRKNIVERRDQLTMQKIIMHILLQQIELLATTDQKF